MEYTVLIGRSGNGYAAMVEGLSGVCTAAAATRAETESLVHEALVLHLEEERLSEVSGVTSMYLGGSSRQAHAALHRHGRSRHANRLTAVYFSITSPSKFDRSSRNSRYWAWTSGW